MRVDPEVEAPAFALSSGVAICKRSAYRPLGLCTAKALRISAELEPGHPVIGVVHDG